jgi:hypothetical protein
MNIEKLPGDNGSVKRSPSPLIDVENEMPDQSLPGELKV